MGVAGLASRHGSRACPPSWTRDEEKTDIDKLLEENARLQELIVQLTKLAMTNVLEIPRDKGTDIPCRQSGTSRILRAEAAAVGRRVCDDGSSYWSLMRWRRCG